MTPPASRWFRWAVAFVWLMTGILVVHPLYRETGRESLALLGLPEWLMYLACAAEVILAIAIIRLPASASLTALQVITVGGFTSLLALSEPMLLVHPFGVLTKNIPLLVVVVMAWRLQDVGWTDVNSRFLRFGMAIIWITEGLFPKILFQQPMELDVVRESGLVPIDPGIFLTGMGAAQVASGILVLVLRERWLSLLLAVQLTALVVLPILVSWNYPELWLHPFGPLTKNVPILAGTLVVFLRHTPVLSADWSDIVLVSFRVPAEELQPYCPKAVQLECHGGLGWLSFVSLDFSCTRVCHLPTLLFSEFPDVNLRTYVRDAQRSGVVFIRELVPSSLVALIARVIFSEPFQAAAIHSQVNRDVKLSIERSILSQGCHSSVRAEAECSAEIADANSDAAFLIERYWGFGRNRWGGTSCFQVTHPPWRIFPLIGYALDIDWASVYGPEWEFLRDTPPASVVVAEGSHVEVWFNV